MAWWVLGFVPLNNFMLEGLVDEYINNLYCLSWCYNGVILFENWEEEYEQWLCEQVFDAIDCTDFVEFSWIPIPCNLQCSGRAACQLCHHLRSTKTQAHCL